MKSELVNVTTAPTLLARGGTSMVPKSCAIQVETAGADVFLGGSDVTAANGVRIKADGIFTIDLMGDEIFGITASGSQAVRVMRRDG